ncbi:hypothetical protein SAY87_007273 [Trapa incisa]|uniref:Uncharacterized protein n=1 Tax=Trapa incisa TaxID=236973 RepID=A0AAN7K1B2_9MYRT|nr:hypothetical protein SAY87_007273 [Trapa incisa]
MLNGCNILYYIGLCTMLIPCKKFSNPQKRGEKCFKRAMSCEDLLAILELKIQLALLVCHDLVVLNYNLQPEILDHIKNVFMRVDIGQTRGLLCKSLHKFMIN